MKKVFFVFILLAVAGVALYFRLGSTSLMAPMLSATEEFATSRTWTARDGRTIQGDFLSATEESVTVLRSDGVTVTILFNLLSEEDIAWVRRQPKPAEITQDQINRIVADFPQAPALTTGEVTNDLRQLHDKYLSMVKFIRPHTIAASVTMIRNKIDADIKILEPIAKTASGDWSGRRGSSQSQAAENGILSARRNLSWLQNRLTPYLDSFDALESAK